MLPIDSKDPLNEAPHCKSCQAPMWEGDAYCSDCGQKAFKGPPSFWKLFGDFFDTVFNLDNRFFRTLSTMVFPGRLTNSYLSGRQKPYLNPLRAFFVSAVIMMAAFTYLLSSWYGESMDEQQRQNYLRGYRLILNERVEKGIDSLQRSYPDIQPPEVLDSLRNIVIHNPTDSMEMGYLVSGGGFSFVGASVKISRRDILELTPREVAEKYGIDDWFSRYQFIQMFRIQNADSKGILGLLGQLVWGLLLLVPVCSLWLKLFYIRRKRRYVSHFIFSLHVHTFTFIAFALATLIFYFTESGKYYAIAGILSSLYFVLSLKNVYKQNWFKTLAKSALLFVLYVFSVACCAIVSAVISVLLF